MGSKEALVRTCINKWQMECNRFLEASKRRPKRNEKNILTVNRQSIAERNSRSKRLSSDKDIPPTLA